MTKTLIAIFLGGGAGSVLRYVIQQLINENLTTNFPWGTFTVNVLGSFLIGLFYALSARLGLSAEIRLLLTTGLCGGFTTFSTFSNDGVLLLKQGHSGTFILYTLASVIIGIIMVWVGAMTGKE